MDSGRPIRQIGELKFRIWLCNTFNKILETECSHDPRYEEARDEYERQLFSLKAQLAEAQAKRPSIVIGLKTATLSGRVEK